jgi:hypothetical protein
MVNTVKLSIRSKIASFIRAVLSSDRSGVLGTGLVNDVGSVMITWMLLGGSEALEQ